MRGSLESDWAESFQRLIGAGHTLESIQGYTLGQFRGFSEAVARMENQRYAVLLNVITVGSRGDGEAVEKMVNSLVGRD